MVLENGAIEHRYNFPTYFFQIPDSDSTLCLRVSCVDSPVFLVSVFYNTKSANCYYVKLCINDKVHKFEIYNHHYNM